MSKTTAGKTESFWKQYYEGNCVHAQQRPVPWLDLSNERVQAQTFGLVLEAVGSLYGRRCLDAGCGWGYLSLMFAALGGSVVGIDQNVVAIHTLRATHSGVDWVTGSILDGEIAAKCEPFDVISATEVLQYVPLGEALGLWWGRLRAGGRMVGVLPNAACPIVQRTMQRFEGKYLAVEVGRLCAELARLPGAATWAVRGFVFREDQSLWPYEATPWGRDGGEWSPRANRLMFVVQKGGA